MASTAKLTMMTTSFRFDHLGSESRLVFVVFAFCVTYAASAMSIVMIRKKMYGLNSIVGFT